MTSPRLLRNFARLLTAISVVMLVFLIFFVVSVVLYKLGWRDTNLRDLRELAAWVIYFQARTFGSGTAGQSIELFTLIFAGVTLWAVMMQSGLALVLRTLARAAERAARRQPERSG